MKEENSHVRLVESFYRDFDEDEEMTDALTYEQNQPETVALTPSKSHDVGQGDIEKYEEAMRLLDAELTATQKKAPLLKQFVECFCQYPLRTLSFQPYFWLMDRADLVYYLWKNLNVERREILVLPAPGPSDKKLYFMAGNKVSGRGSPKLEKVRESQVLNYLRLWLVQVFHFSFPFFRSRPVLLAFLNRLEADSSGLMIPKVKEAPLVFHFEEGRYRLDSHFKILVGGEKVPELQPSVFAGGLPVEAYISGSPTPEEVYTKQLVEATLTGFSTWFMSQPLIKFLGVLSEGSQLKLLVIRSLWRRCVTAKLDGEVFQSGFWFFGAPGTSKTTILKIAKKLAISTTEIVPEQSRFSGQMLFEKNLIAVPDFSSLKKSQIQLLRRLLGRDGVTSEIKYSNLSEQRDIFGQLFLVSNKSPSEFPAIWLYPELRKKIIPLGFYAPIPETHMVGDIEQAIDHMIPLLLPWVLYTPKTWLKLQVRADLITKNLIQAGLLPQNIQQFSIINDFIEGCLVTATVSDCPDNGLRSISEPLQDLRDAFKKWLASSAYDQKMELRGFIETLRNVLRDDYGIRTEKFRPGNKVGSPRPNHLTGIRLIQKVLSKGQNVNDLPPQFKIIELRTPGEHFENHDFPMDFQEVCSRMEPCDFLTESPEDFYETQEKILESRKHQQIERF